MSIPNKQVGWSQESNLLWEVLFQLNKLRGNIASACNKPPVTISFNTTGVNFNLPSSCTQAFQFRCNNVGIWTIIVTMTTPGTLTKFFDFLDQNYSWVGTWTLNGPVISVDLNGNLANLLCPTGVLTASYAGACPA